VTPGRLRALAFLLLLSGAGALVAETVWLRWLRALLGATAPAASATLLAFFTGHALGAAWAGRRAAGWRRPLRVYALLEAGAACAALAVPLLLAAGESFMGGAYDALRTRPAALEVARFGLALAATVPAALCYGATFPALGAAALGASAGLGRTGSGLYAIHTLGAAGGAALGAFWLPDALGVHGAYGVAVALTAAAALGAWALARGTPEARSVAVEAAGRARSPDRDLVLLAALSGAGTLAAQVLLVQAFGQVLNQSVYAFGAVLVVVLLSLAAGAALASRLDAAGIATPTAMGVALALAALSLAGFPVLLFRATGGLAYLGAEAAWPAYLGEAVWTALLTAGPALLAAGLVLPLTFALAARRTPEASAGRALGTLVAANTMGAVAGALAAPYLLLPTAGLWGAFVGLGLLYVAAAFLWPDTSTGARRARVLGLAAGWALLFSAASPLSLPLVKLGRGERVLWSRATASGVVAVIERDGQRLVRTDNHYGLGGTGEILHQERQAHLPMLLHPDARRVAHVGSATGISAGALLAHPVERVHLVEIVPEVARAGARFFADANRGVHDDPRVEVVTDDARNFLAHTALHFDLVIADLFVPWRAGTGALYTREHFQAVRERLAPGGVFCQWLPLYQLDEDAFRIVAATFLDVFPDAALFRGDFYGRFPIAALVGFRDAPPSAARVETTVRRLATRGAPDRWVTHPAGLWSLYVGPLSAAQAMLHDVPRNTVARPVLEYAAARAHRGGTGGLADPFVGFAWQRFSDALRMAGGGTPLFSGLGPDTRRARAGGAALQMAGALYTDGRAQEAARALEVAASLLPPELLADAPPDPSAADLWMAR